MFSADGGMPSGMVVGPHKNGTLWPALTALKPIQKSGCGLQALIRFFSAVHGNTFNAGIGGEMQE